MKFSGSFESRSSIYFLFSVAHEMTVYVLAYYFSTKRNGSMERYILWNINFEQKKNNFFSAGKAAESSDCFVPKITFHYENVMFLNEMRPNPQQSKSFFLEAKFFFAVFRQMNFMQRIDFSFKLFMMSFFHFVLPF